MAHFLLPLVFTLLGTRYLSGVQPSSHEVSSVETILLFLVSLSKIIVHVPTSRSIRTPKN